MIEQIPSENKLISNLVEQDFPGFYHEYGPDLVDFLKQYYLWLETSTNATFVSKLMPYVTRVDGVSKFQELLTSKATSEQLGDPDFVDEIETIVEELKKQYQYTYLNKLPTSAASFNLLVKHALDIYRAKGTPRAAEVFFRGIYNVPVSLYYPGTDMFRPSASRWFKQQYLQVNFDFTDNIFDLVGDEITGTTSGATAIVENVLVVAVQGKLIGVIIVSHINGTFLNQEQITADNTNFYSIYAGIYNIEITDGGSGHEVGEYLEIVSDEGKHGVALVTGVDNSGSGLDYILTNGGSGYLDPTAVTDLQIANAGVGYTNTSTTIRIAGSGSGANVVAFTNSSGSIVRLRLANTGYGYTPGDDAVLGTGVNNVIVVSGGTGYTNSSVVTFSSANQDTNAAASVTTNSSGVITSVTISNPGVGYEATPTISVSNGSGANLTVVMKGSGADLNVTIGNTIVVTIFDAIDPTNNTGSFTVGAITNREILEINNDVVEPFLNAVLNVAPFLSSPPSNVSAVLAGANLSSNLASSLVFDTKMVGSIDYLVDEDPGQGYSSFVTISVVDSQISEIGIPGVGGRTKGADAIVDFTLLEDGLVTTVRVFDSGYGYFSNGSVVTMHSENSVDATGTITLRGVANSGGVWLTSTSFPDHDKYIQDSYYYQEYSYVVRAPLSFETYQHPYEYVMHPAGVQLFGEFTLQTVLPDIPSVIGQIQQANT